MSLSSSSIAEAAKKRTHRARIDIDNAEAQLKSANETLEKAIPEGDTTGIRIAHAETQEAEQAVARASKDLEVVETLLEAGATNPQAAPDRSGEGLQSLMKLLHRPRN